MTPKQLLEKHGGDPLAAADDDNILWTIGSFDVPINPYSTGFVTRTVAHLGEDGAEKWGRVLLVIIACLLTNTPINVFSADFQLLRHTPIEPTVTGGDITRIANATDRERLAACIVALAEVE